MVQIGDKLKNGATVLAYKAKGDYNNSVRAVVLANTNGQSNHPFVTWRINEDGSTYWGHYFASDDEAFKDFNERW